MNRLIRFFGTALLVLAAHTAFAAADIQINTPAITQIRGEMRDSFRQLKPYLVSGAVGLTADGMLGVRDASAIPLDQRQNVSALVTENNQDRRALYREIARANGHPEWESEVQSTFAQRWIQQAPAGWWYQQPNGTWVQK
jgi:uncharacterized protein YdbL (DUF1318 family)